MQSKTIKKILQQKITKWINSIDNEKLRELLKRDAIVTGGSIVSMLLGEDVNDYDIYFKTKETVKAVAEYYVNKANNKDLIVLDGKLDADTSNNEENHFNLVLQSLDKDRIKIFIADTGLFKAILKEGEEYQLAFLSPNAITLTDDIQLIIRFYGNIDEIHKNYDFIHATNSYDYLNNELILNKEALESILTKRLIYSGSLYPLTSIIRTKKFIKRGWNISAGEYVKMCYQVSQLDLNDFSVLEEQLIGVDVAYFETLIQALKSLNKKDDFQLDHLYLSKIIDKIFN